MGTAVLAPVVSGSAAVVLSPLGLAASAEPPTVLLAGHVLVSLPGLELVSTTQAPALRGSARVILAELVLATSQQEPTVRAVVVDQKGPIDLSAFTGKTRRPMTRFDDERKPMYPRGYFG